ncbi:MAG TPA: hypothetical protein GXX19_02890 [Syntrophomonadaceae bacterium]|nr:hypothetical protein [Syntrophomonadaceae bacterium]
MYFQGRPPRRHRRHQQRKEKRFILGCAATYGGCYSPLTKEQLTAAEAKQEFDRRLCAMDGVIGAGRLPSATSLRAS